MPNARRCPCSRYCMSSSGCRRKSPERATAARAANARASTGHRSLQTGSAEGRGCSRRSGAASSAERRRDRPSGSRPGRGSGGILRPCAVLPLPRALRPSFLRPAIVLPPFKPRRLPPDRTAGRRRASGNPFRAGAPAPGTSHGPSRLLRERRRLLPRSRHGTGVRTGEGEAAVAKHGRGRPGSQARRKPHRAHASKRARLALLRRFARAFTGRIQFRSVRRRMVSTEPRKARTASSPGASASARSKLRRDSS